MLARGGDSCWVLVVPVVETRAGSRLGAGAGCRCWVLTARGGDRVPGAGCRGPVLGAGYRCWVLGTGAGCWCPLLTVK